MAGGMLLFILVILLGILTLVSIIMAIVSFANSGKAKFIWLGIFLGSLIGLIFSISMLVSRITEKAKIFGDKFKGSYYNEMNAEANYNFADSTGSRQIEYLKEIEPQEFKQRVPEQFYNYLGFSQYYRLPLKYPFSLHCEDQLTNASLFNEQNVTVFNINDNGEKDCGFHNVSEFVFDENILAAKLLKKDPVTKKNLYGIYHFATGETEQFKTLSEINARVKELRFTRPLKLLTCEEYYQLLK